MGNASSATGEPVWPDCAGVRRDAPPLDCMPCADGRTPCEGNDRRRKHDPFSVAPLPSPSPGQNGRLTHSRVPRSAPWEDPPPLANRDWDSRRQESERRRRDYETIISDYRTQYTSSPSKPLPPKPLPPGPPAMQGQPGEWEVVVRVVVSAHAPAGTPGRKAQGARRLMGLSPLTNGQTGGCRNSHVDARAHARAHAHT